MIACLSKGKNSVDKNSIRLYKIRMTTNIDQIGASSGTTPEYIAAALRQAILQGRYVANQPLRQDRLADELGVSKVPLREALVQLRAEGLVAFKPNRGAVVTELSADEADEIFTMRVALEAKALEKAIPRLRSADFIRAKGGIGYFGGGRGTGPSGAT